MFSQFGSQQCALLTCKYIFWDSRYWLSAALFPDTGEYIVHVCLGNLCMGCGPDRWTGPECAKIIFYEMFQTSSTGFWGMLLSDEKSENSTRYMSPHSSCIMKQEMMRPNDELLGGVSLRKCLRVPN